MSKPRYIMIILILNYILLLLVSAVIEILVISEKAKNVQLTIRTAADMALEQSQVIDDFLAYDGREAYKLLMPSSSGNGFIESDLFGGVFNLDSSIDTNNEKIFDKLYNNQDFKMLALRTDALRTPVKYWNLTKTDFTWYYIPKVSMIGLDMLPDDKETKGIRDTLGNYVPESFSQEIFSAYSMESHVKTTGGKTYYNTPLSFGMTYLNEDLLGALFMNNMDLMMRLKYKENLNSAEGGKGVLKGNTYADRVTGDLSIHNPINNGLFTLLRGDKNPSNPEVESYKGVTPSITYKVIDMYDAQNDDLLVHVFGSNRGSFSSKAEYLKDLDKNVINPVTGVAYTKKPIVVAQVTFYADIVVPYFAVVIREIRGALGSPSTNYVDLAPTSPSGEGNTRRVSYSRYFAVTP